MADNNFSVLLNANLDTSNVPKELKNLNAQLARSTHSIVKVKVGIDEKTQKPIFDEFIKTINTFKDKADNIFKQIKIENIDTGEITSKFEQVTSAIKTTSETTRKFIDDSGALNTVVRNVDKLGQVTQTHTKTYREFGQTVKETANYIEDSKGNLTQVGETFKQVSSVVSETSKSINKYKDDAGAVVTEITELTKQGENLRTVIREEVDEQGRIIKSTELWNNATNQLISSHQEIINDEIKLADQHRKLQQTITNTVSSVHKYINSIGNLVTETISYNQANEKIVTTVTEEVNALGILTRTTREYNETQDKVIKTDIQIIKDEVEKQKLEQQLAQNKKQLTTTTREELQIIEREGEQYKAVVKTIKEQIDANTTLTTTITTYKNKLGETVVETEKVNQAGEHVAQSTKTVTKELEKEAQANKNASNYARENAQAHDTLGNSLARALTTLTQYYVASLPIRAFRTVVSEAVTTVRDFDSALIEFRKVSDLAGESLTNYVAKLAEMGELTGSTMQAMVEASTEFRKSGFNDKDSAELASIAEKYRNVADEEITAAEASSFIIAQMKAFNIEAGQAEHIIDAVNEVANNFSVSSADLARNLGNMSEIMAINNVSMEQQVGKCQLLTINNSN